MLEVDQKIAATLTGDATLTAIVDATNIFTGPVDVVSLLSSDSGIVLPVIVVSTLSETMRPVPSYCRDTDMQLDI
jgi:hypothetical protein